MKVHQTFTNYQSTILVKFQALIKSDHGKAKASSSVRPTAEYESGKFVGAFLHIFVFFSLIHFDF